MTPPTRFVTVIIPNYNHTHYLGDALASVQQQTYAAWQVIVVDDGSITSDAAHVVARFKESRFHYVYQTNQGLSGARNTGLALAATPYVAFLDADDTWRSEFLAASLDVLNAEPELAGTYCRNGYIDEEGRQLPGLGGEIVADDAFRQRLLDGGFFVVHSALLRRNSLARHAPFDVALSSVEDWELWLRLSRTQPLRGLNAVLVDYRVYKGSMSTDIERMQRNRLHVLAKEFDSLTDTCNLPNEARRAYGTAYLASAFAYWQQGQAENAYASLCHAFTTHPPLLTWIRGYYELALGQQTNGSRGCERPADLDKNEEVLSKWLAQYFAGPGQALRAYEAQAYSAMNVALAMLYDNVGDLAQARRHVIAAVRQDLGCLHRKSTRRRLAGIFLGHKRSIYKRRQPTS